MQAVFRDVLIALLKVNILRDILKENEKGAIWPLRTHIAPHAHRILTHSSLTIFLVNTNRSYRN